MDIELKFCYNNIVDKKQEMKDMAIKRPKSKLDYMINIVDSLKKWVYIWVRQN